MTLSWNGKTFDWVNVTYFSVIHLLALAAPWTFSWSALGWLLFFYWVSASLGICLTFHRMLTHRGFSVSKPVEYFLTFCGLLASEGGAITWVAMHRMHHTFSDRPGKDLHTPKDGFWWSHLGWIVCHIGWDRREMEQKWAPEMTADPVHVFLNRWHVVPNIIVGLALFYFGGWSWVIWGVFLRLVVNLHATWFVNSAAHTWGYRTYDTPEGSTNLWWVGLVAWGEGWHNNHHAFQRSARHGHAWWELDLTWMTIRALSAVGIVRDVQLRPRNHEQFRLDKRQPGTPLPALADELPAADVA